MNVQRRIKFITRRVTRQPTLSLLSACSTARVHSRMSLSCEQTAFVSLLSSHTRSQAHLADQRKSDDNAGEHESNPVHCEQLTCLEQAGKGESCCAHFCPSHRRCS